MRIVLGDSYINYISPNSDTLKPIVLSEVVSSLISLESPAIINSVSQLEAFFGKKFPEYEYLKNLLSSDTITLYLYRPVITDFLDNYTIDPNYYFVPDVSPQTEETLLALSDSTNFFSESNLLPEVGQTDTLYKVITASGPLIDDNGLLYTYYSLDEDSEYGHLETTRLYKEIKKSTGQKNLSLKNRDIINIGENGLYSYFAKLNDSEIEESERNYVDPPEERSLEVFKNLDFDNDGKVSKEEWLNSGRDEEKFNELSNDREFLLWEEWNTSGLPLISKYGFNSFQNHLNSGEIGKYLIIDFSQLTEEDLSKSYRFNNDKQLVTSYILILGDRPTYWIYRPERYSNLTFSANNYSTHRIKLANDDFTAEINPLITSPTVRIKYFSDLEELWAKMVSTYGDKFNLDKKVLTIEQEDFELLSFPYNLPEKDSYIYLTDGDKNQKDIYESYIKSCELYRFESKTIGTAGSDGDIWITIEKNNYSIDSYIIRVGRYDYEETFEGYLNRVVGVERLDDYISRVSKLVRFKILVEEEPEHGWVTGSWELRGSYYENPDRWDYQYSLDKLSENNTFTDFFLIPDKTLYNSDKEILRCTEECNCQALVVNNTSDSIKTNLVDDDPDNRLIYFFGDIIYTKEDEQWRPGYDIFLKGLFMNNYLPKTDEIYYPIYDGETISDDIHLGWDYKSNYLVFNNYFYTYDLYYPGNDYNTTPLVRFVISRVSRDLERWKWEVIGEKLNNTLIRNSFERVLNSISSRFTIIRSISVDDFEIDEYEQKLEATITTKMSDLISSNVSFDIVLNYNKNLT